MNSLYSVGVLVEPISSVNHQVTCRNDFSYFQNRIWWHREVKDNDLVAYSVSDDKSSLFLGPNKLNLLLCKAPWSRRYDDSGDCRPAGANFMSRSKE